MWFYLKYTALACFFFGCAALSVEYQPYTEVRSAETSHYLAKQGCWALLVLVPISVAIVTGQLEIGTGKVGEWIDWTLVLAVPTVFLFIILALSVETQLLEIYESPHTIGAKSNNLTTMAALGFGIMPFGHMIRVHFLFQKLKRRLERSGL